MVNTAELWCFQAWRIPTHVNFTMDSKQELISTLDSRTLRPVNVLGLLVLSNNIKNGITDIRDIKRRKMVCPWNQG